MRDSRIEELISAYVDGELSSDERLLVERELEQSSDSRRLFEQLRLQRQMLQSLPRARSSKGFSNAIVRRIEELKVVQPSTKTRELRNANIRRQSLNVLLGIASVVAAGLLISMVLRDNKVEKNILQPPQTDFAVQEEVDPEIRLAAFIQKFPHLTIYEITTTPKGRQNNVLDKWLQAAEIKIDKAVSIEQRMEKRVLESRYLAEDLVPLAGGAKKDVSAIDVEMILIRGKTNQLGNFANQWWKIRGTTQDEIHVKMNLAMSKELAIFMHLNDAIDGAEAVRQVSSDTWTTPGAYRLKFRYAFNTKSASRISTTGISSTGISTAAVPKSKTDLPVTDQSAAPQTTAKLAVNTDEKSKQAVELPRNAPPALDANAMSLQADENAPSQLLLIIRHLNETVEFPAIKGPNGK